MAEPARQRLNLVILAISWGLFVITAFTVMTLSGLVGQRLAPTPALATLPIAAMMLGTLATTLPASLLMKRFGRRLGFLAGATAAITGGVVSVTGITIESFAVFTLGNLLFGAFQAIAAYYRFAAADAASPAWQSRAVSLVLVGGVAAAFLGPLNVHGATDLLATPDAGPYAVIVALGLLTLGLIAGLRVPGEHHARTGAQRPLSTILAQPAVPIAITLMILVMTAAPLAMRAHGHDIAATSTVMQGHVVAMFAPSFVTGHLVARSTLPNVLLAGAALMATSGIVAATGASLSHFWVALVLLGVGWNFLFIASTTLLARYHTAAERGKIQGLNDLVVFTAVAASALLAGALLDATSWTLLTFAILPVLAATAAVIVTWRLRHYHTEPAVAASD